MDNNVAQQTRAFWLRIADWVVFAMRLGDGLSVDMQIAPAPSACSRPQYLPLVDWPPNLFEDEPLLN